MASKNDSGMVLNGSKIVGVKIAEEWHRNGSVMVTKFH